MRMQINLREEFLSWKADRLQALGSYPKWKEKIMILEKESQLTKGRSIKEIFQREDSELKLKKKEFFIEMSSKTSDKEISNFKILIENFRFT